MALRRDAGGKAPEPEPVLRVARSKLDGELAQRLDLGQQLLDRSVQDADQLKQLQREFSTWDEYNLQLLRSRFSTTKVADGYKRVTVGIGGTGTLQQELHWLHSDTMRQIRRLGSIRQQLELYESEAEETKAKGSSAGSVRGAKVFLVHGHDGDAKLQVAELIEKITGERPVILHEQVDSGQTIIEKFEGHASQIGFAVVLLTADDVGSARRAATLNPRARQNVVLEFGFFLGKLGRSRVVALHEEGIELPSDLSGVLYKPLAGNWHTELARELRAAGINIDLEKLI